MPGAGLGHDDLGGRLPDAGDGADQFTEGTKRGHRLIDALVELIDLMCALVDGLQVDTGQEGVVLVEPAGEGFGRLRGLVLQPAFGQVGQDGQDGQIPVPVDQGLQHHEGRG